MIPTVGFLLLLLAFLACAYGLVVGGAGAALRRHDLVRSAERAAHVVLAATGFASVCLWEAFLTRDFSVAYVAQYSNLTLDPYYTFAAFWAGQSGSLLFWLLILCVYASLAIHQNRSRNRLLMPWVTIVLLGVQMFFLVLLNFAANPFERLEVPPPDGRGLNPVLQHPAMAIHPPMLFLGYVGMSVPFAFALASLLAGKMDGDWLRSIRRWTIVTWTFLTVGITLGGLWAYHELGWGGYWGWDPVENASFMPWLLSTAFLHSIMIQERRGLFRVWNMALIIGAFLLTIFGTFITRSGVMSSVHSFAFSEIGPYFVVFLCLATAFSFGMLFYRLPSLKAKERLDAVVSRESGFLLNNVFFLAVLFAVFVGTTWPIVTEAVRGVKVTVGPPFFNFVVPPIALGLLLLTGIGPLLPWRTASGTRFLRVLVAPVAVFVASLLVFRLAGITHGYANVFLAACVFVFYATLIEFHSGARARMEAAGVSYLRALYDLMRIHGRRYGGYVVHVGIVIVFAALTGSNAFQTETETVLRKDESVHARGFTLVYRGLENKVWNADKSETIATVDVFRGEKPLARMKPSVEFYTYWDQPATEVAIRSTFTEDLYVILVSWSEGGETATFRVFVNPLTSWLWAGVLVMVLGSAIAVMPRPKGER